MEEKKALEKLRGYDIFYQEDAKMNPWSIRSRDKELSKKDREELQALLDKYGHKLDKKDYHTTRLQRHEVLIFPGTGLAKIPKVLNKGWNLVRGINTVTTIGKLTPIGNAPSLANVREVAEDEVLPQQGHVSGGVDGAPPVASGQQGKHVKGHKNNDQAVENGDDKSTLAEGTNGVKHTQEAWLEGDKVEGKKDKGEVKEYDTGEVIGTDGETWVRVIRDEKGRIHGFPYKPKVKNR